MWLKYEFVYLCEACVRDYRSCPVAAAPSGEGELGTTLLHIWRMTCTFSTNRFVTCWAFRERHACHIFSSAPENTPNSCLESSHGPAEGPHHVYWVEGFYLIFFFYSHAGVLSFFCYRWTCHFFGILKNCHKVWPFLSLIYFTLTLFDLTCFCLFFFFSSSQWELISRCNTSPGLLFETDCDVSWQQTTKVKENRLKPALSCQEDDNEGAKRNVTMWWQPCSSGSTSEKLSM